MRPEPQHLRALRLAYERAECYRLRADERIVLGCSDDPYRDLDLAEYDRCASAARSALLAWEAAWEEYVDAAAAQLRAEFGDELADEADANADYLLREFCTGPGAAARFYALVSRTSVLP